MVFLGLVATRTVHQARVARDIWEKEMEMQRCRTHIPKRATNFHSKPGPIYHKVRREISQA